MVEARSVNLKNTYTLYGIHYTLHSIHYHIHCTVYCTGNMRNTTASDPFDWVPLQTHNFIYFLFLWRCRFFRVFCTIAVTFMDGEYYYRRTFSLPDDVFFYVVVTGWIFDTSLCDNSINNTINQGDMLFLLFGPWAPVK